MTGRLTCRKSRVRDRPCSIVCVQIQIKAAGWPSLLPSSFYIFPLRSSHEDTICSDRHSMSCLPSSSSSFPSGRSSGSSAASYSPSWNDAPAGRNDGDYLLEQSIIKSHSSSIFHYHHGPAPSQRGVSGPPSLQACSTVCLYYLVSLIAQQPEYAGQAYPDYCSSREGYYNAPAHAPPPTSSYVRDLAYRLHRR